MDAHPQYSQYSSRNTKKLGGIFSEQRLDTSPMRSTGFLKKSPGNDFAK